MDKRLKITLIMLALLLLLSLSFSFYALISKTQISEGIKPLKEAKEKLEDENKDLTAKISSLLDEKREISAKISNIENKFDTVSRERDELKNKFTPLQKEKDSLIEKLQELTAASVLKDAPEQKAEIKVSIPETVDDVYWGSVLRESAELKYQLNALKGESGSVKVKNTELEKAKEELLAEMENLRGQRDELVKSINQNEDITHGLSVELAREKREKREFKLKINKLEKEKLDLEDKIIKLEEEISSLEGIDVSKGLKKTASRRSSIELSPIIVRPMKEVKDIEQIANSEEVEENEVIEEAEEVEENEVIEEAEEVEENEHIEETYEEDAQTSDNWISGKVISINKKDNFIIVNIGEADGVISGQLLDVVRDGEVIAEVKVTKLRNNVSACDILTAGESIEVGDLVE